MTDAIVQVVRCFHNDDIIHVDGSVDPLRDIEVINLELILADLGQIEKRLEKGKKDKKMSKDELSALEKINEALIAGKSARTVSLTKEEAIAVKGLMLLTMKPVIYAANVADIDLASGNDMSKAVFEFAQKEGNQAVLVSAQVEAELATLNPEERKEFLAALGVTDEDCGLKVSTAPYNNQFSSLKRICFSYRH